MADVTNPYAPPSAELSAPVSVPTAYRSGEGLALALELMLGLDALVLAAGTAALTMQLELLERARTGSFISLAEANTNDGRVGSLGLAWIACLLVSAVLWCAWQQRTSTNVHAATGNYLNYGPKAWGWFFCPFINLWRPLQVINELWASAPRSRGAQDEMPSWLSLGWWLPWLIGGILSRLSDRMIDDNTEDIGDLIFGTQLLIGSFALLTVAAAFALVVVAKLQARSRLPESTAS